MGIRDEIVQLGRQLSEEMDKSADLWSWLPSHDIAKTYYGDRWQNYHPGVRDVIVEATVVAALLRGHTTENLLFLHLGDGDEPEAWHELPYKEVGDRKVRDIAAWFKRKHGRRLVEVDGTTERGWKLTPAGSL